MKKNRHWSTIRASALGTVVLGLCGACGLPEDSILARHFKDKPKENAKKRWDGVRGNVTLQLAQQHFKAGRLADAETVISKVRAMSPDNVEVHKLAARVYIELGQLSKAQEAIGEASRLPARDAEVAYLAGIVAERYGRLDEALSQYLAAQAMSDSTPEYLLAAAEMYIALDQPIQAMELLETRVRDFDGFGAVTALAAKVAQLLGRTDQAVNYCREALHDHEEDSLTLAEIGSILVWAGRYGEAIQVLQPMVDRLGVKATSPTSKHSRSAPPPSVLRLLAEAYAGIERYDDAMRILRTVMAGDPADIHAWCFFCRLAILDGDYAAADEAIRKFNTRNQPTCETLLLEGFVALKRGQGEQAHRAAESAIKIDPKSEAAHLLAAESLRSMGAVRDAREACRKALANVPDSPAALAMLAALSMETPDITPDLYDEPAQEPNAGTFQATAFGTATTEEGGDASP